MTSTFGVTGSVKRRNFTPVIVWKQVRRKESVSRTSRPDLGREGFGRKAEVDVDVEEGLVLVLVLSWSVVDVLLVAWGFVIRGVRERVMACTLEERWVDI